jgi:hypothetical protein
MLAVNIRSQTLDAATRNIGSLKREIERVKRTDEGRLRQEYQRLVQVSCWQLDARHAGRRRGDAANWLCVAGHTFSCLCRPSNVLGPARCCRACKRRVCCRRIRGGVAMAMRSSGWPTPPCLRIL